MSMNEQPSGESLDDWDMSADLPTGSTTHVATDAADFAADFAAPLDTPAHEPAPEASTESSTEPTADLSADVAEPAALDAAAPAPEPELAPAGRGFVHLHLHSEYSPLDGLGQLPDVVAAAAADGNPAVASTDHGTLSGAWKLDTLARQHDIKPIIGVEAYLAFGSRLARETGEVDPDDEDNEDVTSEGEGEDRRKTKRARQYMHLTLLAATPTGWSNLVRIVNESQSSASFWSKPRIDYDLLAANAEGIIVLTGCLGGPLAYHLNRATLMDSRAEAARDQVEARSQREQAAAMREKARWHLDQIIDAVGSQNVYIEVMDHGIPAQARVTTELRKISEESGIALVATNDAHFVHADQGRAHEAWLAVSSKKTLSDPKRFHFHGHGHHMRTEAEMRALFDGADWWQEACDNTLVIAERCAARVLPEPKIRLPKFPTPAGFEDSTAYMKHLVTQGAIRRYAPEGTPADAGSSVLDAEVRARLNHEFEVIKGLGFVDYFLIVWDVIEWARTQGIRVGVGRGSAAGSVVSYCLGIVGVDPIRHGLLFERFLDFTRAELPDIDTDFEKGRRGEVLAYFAQRWGSDSVAQLGTFGIARTKAAIKDAARVLDATTLGNRISSKVPSAGGKPLTFASLDDPSEGSAAEYRKVLAAAGAEGAEIIDLARDFEGTTRQPGLHACGVVLSDEPLTALIPTRRNRSKTAEVGAPRITEWEGSDIEAYGLVKMDLLGLRTLDVISACVALVAQNTGEVVDPDALDPDSPSHPERSHRAWQILQAGRTAGVFQLDSSGMTRLCEQVSPDSIDDLSALVALFRPGPLSAGMHERYAERKNGREQVSYDYLTTNPDEVAVIGQVLDQTFATVVFQEQLMQLGEVVAGFDAAERNRLRKAVSKKKADEVAAVRGLFMAGGVLDHHKDGTAKVAFSIPTLEQLWKTFEGSAAYLFNKSHSAAYAQVAYVTAYLKANWPHEYAAALLSVTEDDDKRFVTLVDLAAEGLTVLPPDVNLGQVSTSSDGTSVRLGLSEVKGAGEDTAKIVAARDLGGPFTSLVDMMERSQVSVTLVEALIEAGACDTFGPRLGLMMISRSFRSTPAAKPGAAPRPAAAVHHLPVPNAHWGVAQRAARQRATLGCVLGPPPLVTLSSQLRSVTVTGSRGESGRPTPLHRVRLQGDGTRADTIAMISAWAPRTYAGGRMVSLTLEGSSCTMKGVAFDSTCANIVREFGDADPQVGDIVAVNAKVNVSEREYERTDESGETSMVVETSTELMVNRLYPLDIQDPTTVDLAPVDAGVLDSLAVRDDLFAAPAPAPVAVEGEDLLDQGTTTGTQPAPAPDAAPVVEPVVEPAPTPAPAAVRDDFGFDDFGPDPLEAMAFADTFDPEADRARRLADLSLSAATTVQASTPVAPVARGVLPVLAIHVSKDSSSFDLELVGGDVSRTVKGLLVSHPNLRKPPAGWREQPSTWMVRTPQDGAPVAVVLVMAPAQYATHQVTGDFSGISPHVDRQQVAPAPGVPTDNGWHPLSDQLDSTTPQRPQAPRSMTEVAP
ncbi:DNA polymerase III subunit alpha [Oerskovia enterophila]|uniref:DNA-directed DNA polymerase n=2 Tax=Oerskovia enterophila TaxID=43678 RepID=A0ABX2Y858_9CELL|nr:DNA polymerase III subunit alpha [Oerskovia enterophila]